jgi:hypothetical protein
MGERIRVRGKEIPFTLPLIKRKPKMLGTATGP